MTMVIKMEKEYEIKINDIDYHRGLIPLLKGTIEINSLDILKLCKLKKSKSTDLAIEMFEYYHTYNIKFGMSYIEFLYLGSGDYGLNVYVNYAEPMKYQDFLIDNKRYYKSNVIKSAYSKYNKIVDKINEISSLAEDEVRTLREEYQNEIDEDTISE